MQAGERARQKDGVERVRDHQRRALAASALRHARARAHRAEACADTRTRTSARPLAGERTLLLTRAGATALGSVRVLVDSSTLVRTRPCAERTRRSRRLYARVRVCTREQRGGGWERNQTAVCKRLNSNVWPGACGSPHLELCVKRLLAA
eukprot:6199618-Pleurochrysis_carterae.AAC.1